MATATKTQDQQATNIATEEELGMNKTDAQLLEGIDKEKALELARGAVSKFQKVEEEADTKSKAKKSTKAKAEPKAKKEPKPAAKKSVGDKTYTTAGVSTVKGTMKIRFANNSPEARGKILERAEHTDIRLVEVTEGTKLEIAQQLLTMDEFKDAEAQATIQEFLEKHEA